MKKVACIYHAIDLDGWMSAAIVKLAYENKKNVDLRMIAWAHGWDIPDLSDYDGVIMVDLAFPVSEMESIALMMQQRKGKFIWLDHHKSSIESIQKDWNENVRYTIRGLQTTDYAACEITWVYFFPDKDVPIPVRLLGMYDSFRHKGMEIEKTVEDYQFGARAMVSSVVEAYELLSLGNSFDISIVCAKGEYIRDYLKKDAENVMRKAFPVTIDDKRFWIVNQDRFNPKNFGIHERNYNAAGIGCFWFDGKAWKFSLYSSTVDVSQICVKLGGGGHVGAAGFQVEDIGEFLKAIKV